MAFNWGGAAAGGAGLGALWDVGKKKSGLSQLDTMSPEQKQFFQQLLQMLSPEGQLGGAYQQSLGGLTDLLDPSSEAYDKLADPYMRQFEQETIPGIGEKFAGKGALSSSGFGQSLSAAGGNLQSNLASMKTLMMQKAMQDIMSQFQGMSGQAMGAQPFAYMQKPGQKGLGESLFTQGMQHLPQFLAAMA